MYDCRDAVSYGSDSLMKDSDKSCYVSINLNLVEFAQGVVERAVAKRAPAQRACRVVILPGIEAHHVEILLAGAAILQLIVLLVHLGEANGAIRIVLEIDVLRLFPGRVQSRLQAFCELLVQHLIGRLGDLSN